MFPIGDEVRAQALNLAHELNETIATETDREIRALLLHEIAEIEERIQGNELAAAKGYLAAFNALPTFRPPLFGLIRLYARRRSATNLAKLLDALIKAAPTPQDKADAIVQRGELLEDRFDDPAGARTAFEEAATIDDKCRTAWMALERYGLKHGDPELVRRALLRLAELTTDPARKARLWTEVAWDLVREGSPEALEQASRRLHEAAALPVGRWRALVELERFAERTNRAQDLVAALEGRAALAAQMAAGEGFQGGSGTFAIARLQDADEARATAADLWARAARVRWASLQDPEGALSAMEQSLALQPDNVRFRVYAMHLADHVGDRTRAAEHARWLLEHDYGDPPARAALHFRIAEAAALNGDVESATSSLRAALDLNPESAAALGALIDHMVACGDGTAAAEQFDRLAERESNGPRRAALHRAAAMLTLALSGDPQAALQRFRAAAAADPTDALSRRAVVALASRYAHGEQTRDVIAVIDELLKLVHDEDERAFLLLQKFYFERYELQDLPAAATTAEALANENQNDGDHWALETALWLRAAWKDYAQAARLAETLAERTDGDTQREYTATAVRFHWAAGNDTRARTLAVALQKETPEDPYLTALAFRLALYNNEPATALEVLLRKSDQCDDSSASRWLLVGAVLLAAAGARTQSRAALERAAERTPDAPAVRAALLATTRWRADLALRTRLAETAIETSNASDEEVALGVELALAKIFLEHDVPAAMEVLEKLVTRAGGESPAVSLLYAIATGAQHGPDAPETVAALQAVLGALPAQDPLRLAFELEVARALGASSETREQAREVRELLDEEHPRAAAPRLLALLDAIQREERHEVPTALCRLADTADESTAAALRTVALAALRAQNRDDEAWALAMTFPELPASAMALSESSVTLDRAPSRAQGLLARTEITHPTHQTGLQRRAAVWSSVAGRDDDALTQIDKLLAVDPDDLVAWDIARVAGRRQKHWKRVVQACTALAERVHDRSRAATLWEEAGVVYLDHLRDAKNAETALRKALEINPGLPIAYRKLREILEGRKDHAALEALVTTRIEVCQDAQELTELYWEQARLRRALGRREEALQSAKNVLFLEPEHVAALAMVAEVHATSGRLAEAADALVALASAQETPPAQRKAARLGAVDIYDLRLGQPERALEQLDQLVTEGDADDKAIERGVEIARRAGLWDTALRFATLAVERTRTPEERAQALLRVMEIHRDRLHQPDLALQAALQAHEAMPASLDALQAVHGLADEDERFRRARRTLEALREIMRTQGPSPERALQIAQAAHLAGDMVLFRAAQRLCRALGGDTPVQSVGVPNGRPSSLRDAGLALRYRDPDDVGSTVALLETVLADMAEPAGVTPEGFGVGRSDRIKGTHPIRDALQPYVATVGLGSGKVLGAFELYIGGNDDARVAVIPGDPVAIVLGRRVVPPFDDPTRFQLVRALLLSARGLAPLQTLDPREAAHMVLAALVVAEVKLSVGTAAFEPMLRPVAKALSRKTRKAIAASGRLLAASADPLGEVMRAVRAALSTARRGALALSGAVSTALADLATVDADESARRELCLFAVSDALVSLARETGVDRDGP